tara:strand:+ start:2523 stop:2738 length:216 start_codon:yes stop_codon:yes gene_type:complete
MKEKKFPSSFAIGELVEVVDTLDDTIDLKDIPAGTLGIVVDIHGITNKYYFVRLPFGETQIMSSKWIKKVA